MPQWAKWSSIRDVKSPVHYAFVGVLEAVAIVSLCVSLATGHNDNAMVVVKLWTAIIFSIFLAFNIAMLVRTHRSSKEKQ